MDIGDLFFFFFNFNFKLIYLLSWGNRSWRHYILALKVIVIKSSLYQPYIAQKEGFNFNDELWNEFRNLREIYGLLRR